MGDFSRSPLEVLEESLRNGYVGVHVEQGVPILDRDLNLMHDLVAAVARGITARYIGSGVAVGQDGFQITAVPGADNDFHIRAGPDGQPGTFLVDGIEVTIDEPVNYLAQTAVEPGSTVHALTEPPGTTPPEGRTDTVFLDVWLSELDGTRDAQLGNPGDVGIQTSVRLRPAWLVRVAEGADRPPEPKPGHSHYPLAQLTRIRKNKQITDEMIHDLRQQHLTLADLEQRVRLIERLLTLPAFSKDEQFTPFQSAPGTKVTLFGKHFDIGGTLEVWFGAVQATSIGIPAPTGVTAFVPARTPPGPVRIKVATEGGETFSDTQFTVQPEATGISPTEADR